MAKDKKTVKKKESEKDDFPESNPEEIINGQLVII